MPTYSYQCSKCDEQKIAIRKINDRKTNAPLCCNEKMKQIITSISAPMINDVSARHFDNYICPVTEQVVTSARQKKEIEAANGLVIKEKGIFPPRKKKEAPQLPKELEQEMKNQVAMQKAMHK